MSVMSVRVAPPTNGMALNTSADWKFFVWVMNEKRMFQSPKSRVNRKYVSIILGLAILVLRERVY